MKYQRKVKIIDSNSPYCGKIAYQIEDYTLTNQHTQTKRDMVKVVIPPNDEKWIALDKNLVVPL